MTLGYHLSTEWFFGTPNETLCTSVSHFLSQSYQVLRGKSLRATQFTWGHDHSSSFETENVYSSEARLSRAPFT